MKKLIIVLLLIFITGCGKAKYTECKINFENKELGYTVNSIYKIYSKKSFVTKIVKEEKYSSENKDTIKYLKEAKEIEYSSLNGNYGGYTYSVSKKKNEVIVKATIILKDVDLNKMIDNKYLSNYYVNKNKLSLGGIKEFYKSQGAICE